ncbi:methylated-DNA--[protein]-cysteine S-methyltransferase [Corallococcus macrosporus]|uniref:methylated-DNA--[protein]-cysteine S-methyltransferase n=2 Tax=Myxococcaceae TaxID=31 RepID=A0A250K2P8_9BACT|nr:methylated-DNA--[protein]-cysteine S-methyltransferase [Corallococcus macrosporus]AEI65257.1 ADA regulatory protein [Corallococcus macrosporus]ATB50027.1 methylated-DNA--protein-cysteine methyltransferase [Corallococcus macrosporus DSM 14697]
MASSDYARIEQAILYLDTHAQEQPSLEDAAAHVGLSAFHFQRLFSQWAGISPKRFVQVHTLCSARRLLAERRSVLETSLEVGLSGSGRLHELFVTLTAMTPGEYKLGGEGLTVRYGVHASPFGECLLAVCERGICGLHFLSGTAAEDALAALRGEWPRATFVASAEDTAPWMERIFQPRPPGAAAPSLSVLVRGTPFQVQVWQALLRVPSGEVTTYEDLARAIGKPKAMRAVGSAVGDNPVGLLIPCHRVLRKTGIFGEYRWGASRKRAMLAWEDLRYAGADDELVAHVGRGGEDLSLAGAQR